MRIKKKKNPLEGRPASKKRGVHVVHCCVCDVDFSIAHGGRDDCRRHVASKKHKQYVELARSSQPIRECFAKEDQFVGKETKAEAVMSGLLAELNLPIAAADTFIRAVKVMVPDSAIAPKFQCGRSKATTLIKEMAGNTKNCLADRMRASPFTLSTGGSDDGGSKQFPLVVRTVLPTTLEVRSDVLSVPVSRGSATGDAIFKLIDEEFAKYCVPWENVSLLAVTTPTL